MILKRIAIIIATLFLVVISTTYHIVSLHHYEFSKEQSFDIWPDHKTNETVLNRTISILLTNIYLWKSETKRILRFSFEVFRTDNATEAIQKAIDGNLSYTCWHSVTFDLGDIIGG